MTDAVSIEMAVQLIAEKIRGTHPDWRPSKAGLALCAAVNGRGEFGLLYRTLRGQYVPVEEVVDDVPES